MSGIRSRLSVLVACAASAVFALSACSSDKPTDATGSTTTAAQSANVTPVDPSKPTVVLEHGAFGDASAWNDTITLLQGRGFRVVAPANPLRSISGDSAYLSSVLATIDGPVILVGHSYGGAVITNAADTAPNVTALVYLAAYVPDQGETITAAADPALYPGSLIGPDTITVRPFPNPAAAGGQDADVYLKADRFHEIFAADIYTSRTDLMAVTQRPLTASSQAEPSGVAAWKKLPSWDLITTNDKAIPAAAQRAMAARANATVTEIDSSHAVMLSHPDAVAAIIDDAYEGTQ